MCKVTKKRSAEKSLYKFEVTRTYTKKVSLQVSASGWSKALRKVESMDIDSALEACSPDWDENDTTIIPVY